MNGKDFNQVVSLILKEDSRYERGAYYFLREGLDFTVQRARKQRGSGGVRHVDGRMLSLGLRDFALQQYGPMAFTLFEEWGIHKTADFGEIVYNLVEYGVFGTQEGDRKEDFDEVFDFFEALRKPFLPSRRPAFFRTEVSAPNQTG